jgi:hypothetical protein
MAIAMRRPTFSKPACIFSNAPSFYDFMLGLAEAIL